MTSEELNRAIEFLTQQAAQFWAGMGELKLSNKELSRGLQDLKEQTARFEAWAAEIVAIQSRRLDQNDQRLDEQRTEHQQSLKEQEQLRRDIMRLMNMILDRMPPLKN